MPAKPKSTPEPTIRPQESHLRPGGFDFSLVDHVPALQASLRSLDQPVHSMINSVADSTRVPTPEVVFFGWPGGIGGASTKLAHLLDLLATSCRLTVVPNSRVDLEDERWTRFLYDRRIATCLIENLPPTDSGWAVSLCNAAFFSDNRAERARKLGYTVAWSGEMMWLHPGESEAISSGWIDLVLYASEFQARHLLPQHHGVGTCVMGNYVNEAWFPWKARTSDGLVIGRVSRPDPDKYPIDFPQFYEHVSLPGTRFRVMAWDRHLTERYEWFEFGSHWDLLEAEEEPVVEFLHSVDLFLYPLGHRVQESWGRSTVEAMLCGCVPIVPSGHQFECLIENGVSGFICSEFTEFKEVVQVLSRNEVLRKQVSAEAGRHARISICNRTEHLARWMRLFARISDEGI